MYNVTPSRVSLTIFAVEKQYLFLHILGVCSRSYPACNA